MKKKDRWEGSITVFLSLILSVVLIVVGACLEFARAQAISCQSQLAADAAAESIFAGYHDPLFTQYQLLGRLVPSGSFRSLEQECVRYGNIYGGEKKSLGDQTTLVGFRAEEAEWSGITWMTDQGGRYFSQMAVDSMTEMGAVILAADWLRRLGFGSADTEHILSSNANKDSWNMQDLMEGYDTWGEAVRREEDAAARREAQAEAAEHEDDVDSPEAQDSRRENEADGGSSGEASGVEGAPARESEESRRIRNLIETVRSLLEKGPMTLMIPEGKEISAGRVNASSLPSAGYGGGGSISGGNTLMFHEYLVRHMDCFTGETDKEIAYELEYLIAGRETDQGNLASTINRVFWIRTGMNLLYLNRSPAKIAQVKEAAVAAVGWTGQLPLIEMTEKLLVSIWAASESLVDVRSLLNGQSIALLKTDATWKLGLWEMAEGGVRRVLAEEQTGSTALSYVDYLRICLFLTAETRLTLRAMDVVQWNIRKMDSDFELRYCMIAGEMMLTSGSESIFRVLHGRSGLAVYDQKVSRFSYLS